MATPPLEQRIPGLVFRPRESMEGTLHRWDVTTPEALQTLLDGGSNAPFRDELIANARNAVRNHERYQGDGITGVSGTRKKGTFEVEVTLYRSEPGGDVETKRVKVPVIDPHTYSDYDLRAAFGKPVVMHS